MSLTVNMTFACDLAGCTTSDTVANVAAAEEAGWTYGAGSYGVASMPPPPSVRCPAHKGQ